VPHDTRRRVLETRDACDAPDEVLRDLIEQSRSRSAVYDIITNGVPVAIDIDVA